MKCNLQIDKNGNLKVGGVNAPLFREAMLRTNQNEEASLKIWAVVESEGFKEFNVPPTYDNVIRYNEYRERIDSTPFNSTELSDSMNASIGNVFFQEDFMKSFTNEKGEFEISLDRLKKVNLYSSSEIYNLLSDEKLQRNVKKFYNKSLNFEAPITTSEARYVVKSDNEISSLGFFKRENPDVINETLGNIFAGIKSKEDFDNRKMKVDEQWEAVKYEDISNDFSDKTSIAQYVENPLTNELELKSYNNTYYETLFGTEIGENNEKAVEIIDLITSLTPEQLSDTSEIKYAFNTLSKELIKSGIDFVGIENQYGEIPSPKIIELLLHTKNILTNEAISEEGLQNYVDVYNEVFEKSQNTKKSLFDGIVTNSMKIEKENISDASLFLNNHLVKIKDNVYKKINRNYEDVYEAVYNLMKNGGKQVIPFDVSKVERVLYKEKVIRELREFASKKSQGVVNDVEATNEEIHEMTLLTEYFKEGEQIVNPKIEWVKFERLSKIKDVESWKSRFIQKMNKEMISQKMKGNQLPLTITQRGLEMKTDGDYSLSLIKNSIPNALYSDLVDYGLLTNQDFLATEEGIFIDEGNVDFQRNLYANNPNLISEYNGVVEYGQGTDLKAVGDTFIKVGGIVYEKVNGNVYGLVSNQGEQTWNRQIPKVSTKPSENKILGKKTIKQTTNFNVNVEERNPITNEIENIEIKYEGNERRRDRARWDSRRGNQTLEGSPIVEGSTGADPELTSIAEEYALSEGIDYRRQSEYVKVDVDRAKRIAQAYEDMKHEPQNPKVKEAYQNLINQTLKQYNFLVNAGYKFYLMDETNDPYGGNPWNAMRDLRNNKTMGVFATEAGFGSSATELDVSDNPMLEDMKITWGYGSVDGEQKRVLANDLFRCFTPETLVRTSEGFKEIQDIKVGDLVLTHEGRFKKVYDTIKNPHKGKILNISTNASYNPIRVTPEHPFYVLKGTHGGQKNSICTPYICDRKQQNGNVTPQEKYHSFEWVEAKDLKEKMWFPLTVDTQINDINFIEIPNKYYKGITKIPQKIELTEDFLSFVGLYIAEGSGGTNRINISLHKDEKYLIDLVDRFAKSIGYSVKSRVSGNGITLQINCKILRDWFSDWLGRGSNNKKIPNELLQLPPEKLKHIAYGIFSGDGKKKKNNIEQTSLTLALQLMEVGARLGLQPTANSINYSKNDRHSDTYTTHEFLKTEHNFKQKKYTWRILEKDCRNITKIEEEYYEGFVYNIEVEDDHSYVVENVPVHNCVHDAFGHGLEGAGFRARGEENAWQAHARLFTGSALSAITSETRGQNSWLNYGKFGEQNRTAKVEDTVFADQKTGLMPEWTWKEGFNEGRETSNEELLKQGQDEAKFATPKESEIFKTLSSIPLLNEDEALKAYKNIYSNKMFDWKNQEC